MSQEMALAGKMLAAGLLLGLVLPAWGAERPVDREIRALAEASRAERSGAWLGVFLSDALDGGVAVVALVPDGPAQRAGLRDGDLILEVGGEATPNQEALDRLLERSRPGEVVEVGFLRGGESLTARVELGRRGARAARAGSMPPAPPEPAEPPTIRLRDRLQSRLPVAFYGLQVAEMTPALRDYFGAPRDAGVLVLGMESAEATALAGFQVGDVLVQLGGRDIRDEDQLTWTIASWTPDRPLQARIIRAGQPVVVDLKPATAEPAAPAAAAVPRIGAEGERALLERRIRAEIERLEQRLQALREELEELQKNQ